MRRRRVELARSGTPTTLKSGEYFSLFSVIVLTCLYRCSALQYRQNKTCYAKSADSGRHRVLTSINCLFRSRSCVLVRPLLSLILVYGPHFRRLSSFEIKALPHPAYVPHLVGSSICRLASEKFEYYSLRVRNSSVTSVL
jgi:hypothetical protein